MVSVADFGVAGQISEQRFQVPKRRFFNGKDGELYRSEIYGVSKVTDCKYIAFKT